MYKSSFIITSGISMKVSKSKQTFKNSSGLGFVHFEPIKSFAWRTSCLFVLHHIFLQVVRKLRGPIPGHSEVLFVHLEVNSLFVFLFTLSRDKCFVSSAEPQGKEKYK